MCSWKTFLISSEVNRSAAALLNLSMQEHGTQLPLSWTPVRHQFRCKVLCSWDVPRSDGEAVFVRPQQEAPAYYHCIDHKMYYLLHNV